MSTHELKDDQQLSSVEPVFNRKKFYPGRAIVLTGECGDGDKVDGVFLIRAIKMDKLYVVDSDGREKDFDITAFLTEVEGDEVYPPCMAVEFYGKDRP